MTEELHAFVHSLGRTLKEWIQVSNVLHQDIENLLLVYKEDWSSQPFRRLFVRSCWALIEGEAYGVKQFTLRACELGGKSISVDEHRFLSEIRLIVGENSAVELKPVHVDTLTNLKETLKIAASEFELDWTPNFGTQGWKNMSFSLELR